MTLRRVLLAVPLLATLAGLLLHARVYAFLCDDAFISFRYAKNLAEGHGLVFNPGFERVEGYTNFLWVWILAAGQRFFDMRPEDLANPLLVACTVGLWALVASRAASERDFGEILWPALVAPALLACTRSVAVWTTSGLETRLFELLVVAATFRLLHETRTLAEAERTLFPWSGLLFALATLTRPDGLLIAGCAILTARGTIVSEWRRAWRTWVLQGLLFAVPVGAHFLWRFSYYGSWLPNTYHAKVGGRTWWEMGTAYLSSFALEYFAVLWIPFLLFALVRHFTRRSARVPLVYAAVIVPHALYIARIGGDHFEYRPLDLYFPFLLLLIGDGVREIVERARATARPWKLAAAGVWGALLLLGIGWIPWRAHEQFPGSYVAGFPGLRGGAGESTRYLDPARDPLLRLPGLSGLASRHRTLLRETTSRFVGVRAEEHRLFLGTVQETGERMRRLVDEGILPSDTHIAISAVGAIPYLSGLRTLDRLGLTDAEVARSSPADLRILAHDKHATFEYAAAKGVDLWSQDPVHPLLALDDYGLRFHLDAIDREGTQEVYFADAGDDAVLLVRLPSGEARARERFPRLEFFSTGDPEAVSSLRERIERRERERLAANPDSVEARIAHAVALEGSGKVEEAVSALRAIPQQENVDVQFQLGNVLARAGRFDEAAPAFERATRSSPEFPGAWYNLGLARSRLERWEGARSALETAVALDETDPAARYALGVSCLMLGDRAGAEAQARALEAIGTETSLAMAERLRAALSPLSK